MYYIQCLVVMFSSSSLMSIYYISTAESTHVLNSYNAQLTVHIYCTQPAADSTQYTVHTSYIKW